jgi:hypothetical protein
MMHPIHRFRHWLHVRRLRRRYPWWFTNETP